MAAIGLQCGFNAPLGPVLDELRAIGFTIIRTDLQKCSLEQTTEYAQEILDAGLQPLCIIRHPDQMNVLPEGSLIELGNEPNFEHEGWGSAEAYVEVADECVKLAIKNNQRLYVGAISNLNFDGLNFLRKIPWDRYPASNVGCSIHRYPDGHSPQNPHTGFASRDEEVEKMKEIVGNRPIACTEVGYHTLEWTDTENADNMIWERQFFTEHGFEIVSGYQINDGPSESTDARDHYGYRHADTGVWKPVAWAFADTAFPPLEGLQISLRSDHGKLLSVQQNQTVVANRDNQGAWETFQVTRLDGDKIGLRSWQWQYLTAEVDDSVMARAREMGPWETWTFEVLSDNRLALKSDHGKYLTAEVDGTVAARAEEVGPWESWESYPPNWWVKPAKPSNGNQLQGVLTREGRVVYDEGGVQTFSVKRNVREVVRRPRILMFCHAMELFSAWCHGKEREVTEQCMAIARRYAGIRFLDVLGYWDIAWRGREVTPISFVNHSGTIVMQTPRYWEQKAAFLFMLNKLGLKVMDDRGDMNTWGRSQKLEHMLQNGRFYGGLPFGREILAGLWAGNEGWQNGVNSIDLAQDMLRAFESGAGWLPALRGLSAPGGDSDPFRLAQCDPPMDEWEPEAPCSFVNWSADPATVLTIHGNRGNHENITEHYFAYGYDDTMRKTNKVAYNTEPVGPGNGVSVGRVNDVELLCGLTMSALIGGQAWTYMSGFGVFWDGPIDSQVGFNEIARLTKFLPPDIASWRTVVHGGTRFYGIRILAANDPTRAEHAISADGRFAIVAHTEEGRGKPMPCERACSEFTVINMVTGETESQGPMPTNRLYTHDGAARLITGKLV